MKYCDYELLLQWAVDTSMVKLDIHGRPRENDPVYALTNSDFSVSDDEKFHILIAGLHVGGQLRA